MPEKYERQESAGSERLLRIVDEDNAYPYYVSVIDEFPFNERDYVALLPYEPDDGMHKAPEFVLMRRLPVSRETMETFAQKREESWQEICFEAIRSKAELHDVFDHFVQRLENGLCQTPPYAPN